MKVIMNNVVQNNNKFKEKNKKSTYRRMAHFYSILQLSFFLVFYRMVDTHIKLKLFSSFMLRIQCDIF